jgi:PAS domain-containing protein
MPVEVTIWRVNKNSPNKISYSAIDSEKKLEEVIFNDISILGDEFLLVGRQVRTDYGKFTDLLTISRDGKITIIELKKNKTPREVVSQALDYASWIQDLSYKEIAQIYKEQFKNDFDPAFEEMFGVPPPDSINQTHDIIIVCSELDNETERIINYLSENYNVPINVVFFRFFKDGESEYITRSWLIDPAQVEERSSKTKTQKKSEEWNGKDFIVNIDVDQNNVSSWNDAIKFGFISAGGGSWYSRTLNQLFPGARVFAMLPKKGYLGVGIVKEKYKPMKEFKVINENGETVPIIDVELEASALKNNVDDFELCEYFVRVEWVRTVSEKEAYWEKGLRANQNSAFKLKSAYTLEKLLKFFELDE